MSAEKVLHWEFEGSLADASSSNNGGVFSDDGNPRFVDGRFGAAIRLESGESIVCHSVTNIPTAKGESWTINLWARLTEPLPDGAILGGFGGRAEIFDDKRFIICFNDSIYFWEGDGTRQRRDLDSETRFPADGNWHMYTVMFDSNAQRLALSVDAKEIAVMQPVTTLADALPKASVGGAPDFFGDSFQGEIDEFAIWVGSLTNEQIQRLFVKNTAILSPPLWQRVWFVSVLSLLLGSGVTVGLRIKERRRQQRRIARLERETALERERARIAQDIHDDLGAGLTRVGLLGAMTADELENPQEAQALTEEISSTARELVGRLDEIVWAVDPKNDSLEALSSYLLRYSQEYLETAKIRLRLDFPPSLPDCAVSPDVRHHFLMAFKEGLNNLVKHASASECVIRMTVSDGSLTLVIQDDGHGFDDSAQRESHDCGLPNMRDRMLSVQGQFRIESSASQGTRVEFELPLNS
ncbi:MAG: histidine kinase [Verrucomicrobiales bacterium]|nr:histidine kinase [Verrucomicrobiales bacterium]